MFYLCNAIAWNTLLIVDDRKKYKKKCPKNPCYNEIQPQRDINIVNEQSIIFKILRQYSFKWNQM